MSAQSPNQATQHTASGPASKEIAEFFAQAGEMRSQPRLRGISGVCRFDIAGAGVWSVTVNDGEASIIEGAGSAPHADCVVSCSAGDFLRILHGENHLNLLTAALQGLLNVTGDKVFAMELLGNIVVAPIATTRSR